MSKIVITGCGRSGTMWLSKFLDAKHEPRGFVDSNLFYGVLNGHITNQQDHIKDIANAMEVGHIEVNSFMRIFIKELIKEGVDVYGLVRHPQDVVSSMYNSDVLAVDDKRELDYIKCDRGDHEQRLVALCSIWNETANKLLRECKEVFILEYLNVDKSYAKDCFRIMDTEFSNERWKEYKNKKIHKMKFSMSSFNWNMNYNVYNRKVLLDICGENMKRFNYTYKEA